MTLAQEATLTEEAIATKLAQLQSDIKQLNPDYELRPIPTFNRRWQKTVLHSYSVWQKGMPGVKKFVLSDYGTSKQDLERRWTALEAITAWIEEHRRSKLVGRSSLQPIIGAGLVLVFGLSLAIAQRYPATNFNRINQYAQEKTNTAPHRGSGRREGVRPMVVLGSNHRGFSVLRNRRTITRPQTTAPTIA